MHLLPLAYPPVSGVENSEKFMPRKLILMQEEYNIQVLLTMKGNK